MKKSIFFAMLFIMLNGCAQYSSLMAPSYTLAKSGNALQAGNSLATSYVIKKSVNKQSFISEDLLSDGLKECETYHSSNLNEIFFETLNEIGCYQDPFSVLR
tara:strand:- start:2797 stop:3102 length:306 start_codon:yes stop_codon:yes gene_type:complete